MATITINKHIALSTFQNVFHKKYSISANEHKEAAEEAKN
jgi:hypothetical protein